MDFLEDFESFNQYVGLPAPLGPHIDAGHYNSDMIRLRPDPFTIGFYRISIKVNFTPLKEPGDTSEPLQPINAIFFNSPGVEMRWNNPSKFEGYYLLISQDLIEQHRFLFKNYLEYGEHEALYLTGSEQQEIIGLMQFLIGHLPGSEGRESIVISYVSVLLSLVETLYKRQFSRDMKKYNYIVSDFQQHLNGYYQQSQSQLPSVKYFADKMNLTSNYLGDIIRHFTQKTAMETIQDFVIEKAQKLLRESKLNNSEIAYELGFEYPNYFAKVFKKHTQITPTQYRSQFAVRR